MNKIKLVMIDLDGTVLVDHKRITKQTEKMIDKLIEMQVEVVPATGRHLNSIPDYFLNHKGINYIVSSGGSLISNGKEDLFVKNIDKEMVDYILKKSEGNVDHGFVATNKGIIATGSQDVMITGDDDDFVEKMKKDLFLVDSIYDHVKLNNLDVKKIYFDFTDLSKRNELHGYFSSYDQINTVSSMDSNIEITSKDASKGIALHYLKDHLNIKTEEVLAIGDSENDISMLIEAGIGVAMGNASDEVKAVSDIVTRSLAEDGFYHAIKKVFKLN